MLRKVLVLLFFLIILSGCRLKNQAKEISFSSWGSVTEVKIIKELISDFEKENPDIKINFIHIPQNYFQKLHLLFASNTAPDVVFVNNLYLPLYSEHLLDLSGFVNKQDFYYAALESLTIDGKILAIPRDASNLIFYVNTDLVQGLTNNLSLNDIVNISLGLKSKNIFGISFEEDIYWAQPYLTYFGETFNDNFNPETSKGFLFYKDLRDKYKIAPTKAQIGSSTLAQMFLDEKVAMYLSGRWMYPKILEKADFNWKVVLFPKRDLPQACDASGWAISKRTKNKELAIKFVQFLSEEKNIKNMAKTGLIVPANKNCSEILNNKEHQEYVFLEALESSQSFSISKNYKKLIDKFNSENF